MSNRILKIGLDVHVSGFTACVVEPRYGQAPSVVKTAELAPDFRKVLTFVEGIKKDCEAHGDTVEVQCGYEAGCLGYSLYNQLMGAGVPCVILAPTTMLSVQGPRIKTDKRDALNIANCLSTGLYESVYVLDDVDEGVRAYMRMRDDAKTALKKVKQQINAQCHQMGRHYDPEKTKWTGAHVTWLRGLKFTDRYQQLAFDERLAQYDTLVANIERYDAEIEEIAKMKRYEEKVDRLGCLLGVKTHTAVALLCEIGDFDRFAKGNTFAAYLGLAPGERSSGDHTCRTGISKAGNSHLRRLLIESAQGICKGKVGHKSKDLKARQKGNPPAVIAYADNANKRMRSKYYRMIARGKKRNVAVAAVARELACFCWGVRSEGAA